MITTHIIISCSSHKNNKPKIDIQNIYDVSIDIGKKYAHLFYDVEIGSKSSAGIFYIYNNGNTLLKIDTLKLSGNDAKHFELNNKINKAVKPNDKTLFSVYFTPKELGTYEAEVIILSNDPDKSQYYFFVAGESVKSLDEDK